MPETLNNVVEQISTKIETILKYVADFFSLMSIKTMAQEIANRIEHGKGNVEIACSIGLFRGKYRKQEY